MCIRDRPTGGTGPTGPTGGTGPTGPTGPSGSTARFVNNYSATTYSGNSYYSGNWGNHLSTSITPSNSNNRVLVFASFELRRGGSQNNNWYARARLAGGGDLRDIKIVSTNSTSYSDSTSFQLFAYDAAGNTSNRTYYLQVNYTASSSSYANVQIQNASLAALELRT